MNDRKKHPRGKTSEGENPWAESMPWDRRRAGLISLFIAKSQRQPPGWFIGADEKFAAELFIEFAAAGEQPRHAETNQGNR
jgi:hypothetical protein